MADDYPDREADERLTVTLLVAIDGNRFFAGWPDAVTPMIEDCGHDLEGDWAMWPGEDWPTEPGLYLVNLDWWVEPDGWFYRPTSHRRIAGLKTGWRA